MELSEVAPHVYAGLVEDRGWSWSNSGFVNLGGGLVVDTLMDVGHTRQMLELYATVSAAAPQRLVNTHHNPDHCWGNQLLRDAEIIGHRHCVHGMLNDLKPAVMQAMLESADLPPGLRWFAGDVALFDFRDVEVTPPNRVIDGDLTLDLGGTETQILYVGPAHTAGDVIVHLPEQRVVFAGDILFHQCTPIGWEGTTAGWRAALERIVKLDPAVVVPGHGPLADVDGVKQFSAYLQYVFDESKGFFDQDLSAMDAAKRMDLGPHGAWKQPERLIFNVERAYREHRGGEWNEVADAIPLFDAAVELREYWDGRWLGARSRKCHRAAMSRGVSATY